jgi:hypothetical protein
MEPNLAGSIYVRSSIKFLHLVPFGQQTWPPRLILFYILVKEKQIPLLLPVDYDISPLLIVTHLDWGEILLSNDSLTKSKRIWGNVESDTAKESHLLLLNKCYTF